MNRQGRVLVVDDLEQWRKELVQTLQREGFYAEAAPTVAYVLERLDETFYHVLLLDIRMDEADQGNTDGIELLGRLNDRGLSSAVKVIMLSAHDTKEQMRTAFIEYNVADFLSKHNFTRPIFLGSMRRVFAEKMMINLSLIIHWQRVRGPEQVVLNLEIGGARIKRNSPLQQTIALELEDLLCRLFHQAESILIHPLSSGKSGTGVLRVQPFYAHGGGRALIVKFGDFHTVEDEHGRFKQHVQPFVGGGRNTTVLDVRRTPHLGGILYSLLGADYDHLEDFGHYYCHAPVPAIQQVLDDLFLGTCSSWYANRGKLEPRDLTREYQQLLGFTPEKLERSLFELQKTVQGKQKLIFKALYTDRLFTNPILALQGPALVRSTYTCVTHGDLNQYNFFVDDSQHTWLIDFQSTGQGHILRDIAQLDAVIRLHMLAVDEASLPERLCLEEALCVPERFSDVGNLEAAFETHNPALGKAYAVTAHLRRLAHNLVARKPGDDISEYYIALFYYAINMLRFYKLPAIQREHALISASLLADRLGLKG